MRITEYRALPLKDLLIKKIKYSAKLAILPDLQAGIDLLTARAKKITKRETSKLEETIKDLCPKYGSIRVRFGPGRVINNYLSVDLLLNEEIRKGLNGAWLIELFEIDYPVMRSWTPDAIEHSPAYPKRDLSVEGYADYLANYDKILSLYPKIPQLLKEREEAIKQAEKSANKKIPDCLWSAIESYS